MKSIVVGGLCFWNLLFHDALLANRCCWHDLYAGSFMIISVLCFTIGRYLILNSVWWLSSVFPSISFLWITAVYNWRSKHTACRCPMVGNSSAIAQHWTIPKGLLRNRNQVVVLRQQLSTNTHLVWCCDNHRLARPKSTSLTFFCSNIAPFCFSFRLHFLTKFTPEFLFIFLRIVETPLLGWW